MRSGPVFRLKPKLIARAARSLFGTAHSDIIVFLALKYDGARIEGNIASEVKITSANKPTDALRYLAWISDSFSSLVQLSVENGTLQNNQPPLPSAPQGVSRTVGYPLFFPISDNRRYLLRKEDSNRSVIWTRLKNDWFDKQEQRYGLRPREFLFELIEAEQGQGARLRLRPKYLDAAPIFFGPDEHRLCSIPWIPFVIWCCRNEVFEVQPNFDQLAHLVRSRLSLSDEELYFLFTQRSSAPNLQTDDFEQDRDEEEYNHLILFGQVDPFEIRLREASSMAQMQFNAQLLGISQEHATDPIELTRRIIQKGQLNVLLTGAPRTGKSYSAVHIAEDYLQATEAADPALWAERVLHVQFHQEWRYGDFIQRLTPKLTQGALDFAAEPGLFLRHCQRNADRPSVVIIEELNRANVAAVFGEGFHLIEMGYRGTSLPLPHGGGNIVIPKQLLLIATMNTLDRLTYPLDYALLSRFRTVDFAVSYKQMFDFLVDHSTFTEDDAMEIVAVMRQITELTKYPIGHAHFVDIKDKPDLMDWYMTVLRPSLQLFLTQRQESVVTDQVDPLMATFRS